MERAAVVRPNFPTGHRIIAVSDIHGNLPFFRALMEQIRLTPDDILVLVGDMLEKGRYSLALLRHLMELCRGGVIDKRRFRVRSGAHVFEVDEFYGDNEGLVMAEVELKSPDEPFEKPDFIGPEVTGDRRFYNKHMLKYPFSLWRDSIPEDYR